MSMKSTASIFMISVVLIGCQAHQSTHAHHQGIAALGHEGAPLKKMTRKSSFINQYPQVKWMAAYPHVVTHCFPGSLQRSLNAISDEYGKTVLVTSGFRRIGRNSESQHKYCKAADIRVTGIRPSVVARFARTLPEVGGVGTYHGPTIVHIDVREEKMAWRY